MCSTENTIEFLDLTETSDPLWEKVDKGWEEYKRKLNESVMEGEPIFPAEVN